MGSRMSIVRRLGLFAETIKKNKYQKVYFEKSLTFVKKLSELYIYERKCIIDCGFNQGIVAGKLLEGLPGFILRGFEIQQDIKHYSNELKRKLPDRDIDVIYSAISNKNGDIEYYEPEHWGKNYKGGTTTVDNKIQMDASYAKPKVSPCIDFSQWLENEFAPGDFLFVKMDIEGAEYDVIEHLMKTKMIDMIDVLAVEWHSEKFPEPQASRYRMIEKEVKNYARDHAITVMDWY